MFNKSLNPKNSFVQHSAKCVKNQKITARCGNSTTLHTEGVARNQFGRLAKDRRKIF